MKRLLCAAGLLCATAMLSGAALGGQATSAPAGGHNRQGLWQKLGQELGITADQKAQIKTIMQAARQQAQGASDRAAKREIFRAAFENIKKNVLTAEQVQKLEQLRKQWKAEHPGAGHGQHGHSTSQPA